MLDIALGALPPPSSPSSWILDGFPRTIAQGRMLDERLTREGRPLNMIVNLGVSDATILKRIAGEDPASLFSSKEDYPSSTSEISRF